ncbi:SurA N-terminal domain-containing protein [Phenylobacterium sp.]|uniref:peptidylprolyl isomerase n=1 Tax=Phenylobacterium sp. TaxID=1871053 RepID=UPI00301E5232
MLAATRQFAKSWPARILLILLALGLVTVGANQGGLLALDGDQIVKAGSRSVNAFEFRREYDNFRRRLEEQSGQPVTPEIAQENNLDANLLNGLATREAFAELLSRMGVKPSDKLILEQIQQIPAFFDPVSGRFDRQTFEARLRDNGLTPEAFDDELRDQMAAQHFIVAIQNGLAAPRTYGAVAAVFATESRDLAYVTLNPNSVPRPAAPTDEQLNAFIKENAERLTIPEMRVLTVAPFTTAGAQAGLGPIDAEELQKRYEFRKDTLSTPETRSIVQVPVKDQASAQQVAARLTRGEDPAAVAKSIGVEAVRFDQRPLTAVSDRKVGEAAFRMADGQVAAVQGDLGLSVVKVLSVTPGREVSLEDARPMLEAEIRKDMVAEKVHTQTEAYEEAHQGGASLADSARKAGVNVLAIGPVTAQGQDENGQPIAGLPPKILETAFGLGAGSESDLTDLGDGSYFAVRVERVVPARVPPLDDIRGPVTQFWMQREVVRALEARAKSLTDRMAKGETLEAVAASSGLSVSRLPGLTRQNAGQHQQALGGQVLSQAFSAKTGEAWSAGAPTGLVVGRVEAVRADGGPTTARLADASRGELTQVLFREMGEAAQVYARNKLKVRINRDKARTVLGFPPLPKGGDAAAGKNAEKKK